MLRIIAGKFKGRRLKVPDNHRKTRPTLDRVKESIFNVLAHNVDYPTLEDAFVLDLFAGSGSLGFEALSRGAKHVTFVDIDQESLKCCRDNARSLGVENCVTLLRSDTRTVSLSGQNFDVILIDPPYYKQMSEPTIVNIVRQSALAGDHVIALEMAADEHLSLPDGIVEITKETVCGPGRLYFLQKPQHLTALEL
jgi:16S rRNA (guanine966-N2)-methyltransferase